MRLVAQGYPQRHPLLIAAGLAKNNLPVPWLQNKKLRLMFG
jgi:hypothetical protein